MRSKEGDCHMVMEARTSPMYTAEEIKQDRARNLRRVERQRKRRQS
jgi:hypothetical protein